MDDWALILDQLIAFIFINFGLAMFIVAAGFMLLHRALTHGRVPEFEIIYRWTALFPLGIVGIYSFVMHAFFPEMAAEVIGWSDSPFQYEVAVADLAFGVLAILSFNASIGFRLAAVIGNTIWLWGDAFGHIRQMLVADNFSAGNAGSWFWMDVWLPPLILICLYKIREFECRN